ncbi:hypothetical protein [Bradyrhizobium sp.]|uniref:hypothetical protein n=1 Tax=Bradyrhizobium sp. TaxID=376 RepID=UPI00342DF295
MESSIPEHEQIMQAILRNDAAQAGLVMRSHVTLLGDGLSDLLHFPAPLTRSKSAGRTRLSGFAAMLCRLRVVSQFEISAAALFL